MKAFQDYYPEDVSHCYGCGHLNEHGHQIKSFWDGDESVCHFKPSHFHTAIPGYVYGRIAGTMKTDRDVIDNTYSYSMVITFDSKKEHDIYQEHPAHKKFIENASSLWDKVLVYDSVKGN